jgi:pimeloyl-ACP methyl ester carboxylesterase
VKTPGRFYFAPKGTPFVDGYHNFWSRRWLDGNNGLGQELGEDLHCKQPWDRGDPPAILPENVQLGSSACLTNGDSLAEALDPADIENGFPVACYAAQIDDHWLKASAWSSCSMQFFYARIISWLYSGNTTAIGIAFRMLLGNSPTITYHPGTSLLPDVVTVVWPTGAIACVDGTNNFQQLAAQAFLSIIPPTNIGLYGSLALWYAASSWVNNILNADGVNPDAPVILVGHSYGAAAVANLGARYRAANADRAINFLTFGGTKPGDQRLQNLLASCPGLALADDDDPIPALPPNNLLVYPVALALGQLGLLVWDEWQRMPNQALQASNGFLTFNQEATLGFATLLNFAQRAIAGQPLPVFPGHEIDDYAARILTRCPFPEWPVDPPLWDFLTGHPKARGGALGGGKVSLNLKPRAKGGALGSGLTGAFKPIAKGGALGSGSTEAFEEPRARGGAVGSGSAGEFEPTAQGGALGSGSAEAAESPEARGGAEGSGSVPTPVMPLRAGAGAFVLTGIAAALVVNTPMIAGRGSFVLTGQAATLTIGGGTLINCSNCTPPMSTLHLNVPANWRGGNTATTINLLWDSKYSAWIAVHTFPGDTNSTQLELSCGPGSGNVWDMFLFQLGNSNHTHSVSTVCNGMTFVYASVSFAGQILNGTLTVTW